MSIPPASPAIGVADCLVADRTREFRELVGHSRRFRTFTPTMFDMLDELSIAAAHDVTVLLIGETGSGKTHLARLIHELSPRSQHGFCNVACGALPPDLIESELFGHAKGAFTGAERDREGKFSAAGNGTLLLDEIDVLPLDHQAKLLRVIETGEYEAVGTNDTQRSAARLVVASNLDLETLVAQDRFRVDLFYRLNVLRFQLLPLRQRPLDIPDLAIHFASMASRTLGVPFVELSPDVLDVLRAYRWPGNIRELENVMRRAVLYCKQGVLTPDDLPESIRLGANVRSQSSATQSTKPLEMRVGSVERRIIEEALLQHDQHRGATARALGISRVTLYNKMKKFGLLS